MNTLTRIATAMTIAACMAPHTASQGPDPELLPADTEYIAHFDIQRISKLLGARELIRKDSDAREAMDRIQDALGADPIRDIRTLTVFGGQLSDKQATIMVQTTDRLDDVLGKLREDGALSTEREGGLRFLRVRAVDLARTLGIEEHNADDDDGVTLYVKKIDNGRRAVLIGKNARDLLHAARVLAGDADSLADTQRPALSLRTSRDAIAYVEIACSFEEITRRTPASQVANAISRVAVELIENEDEIELRAVAAAKSKKNARDVASIIDGLRALTSLTAIGKEIPEVVRDVIASARAESEGTRITIRLSVPIDALRDLLDDRHNLHRRQVEAKDEDKDREYGVRRDRRRRREIR